MKLLYPLFVGLVPRQISSNLLEKPLATPNVFCTPYKILQLQVSNNPYKKATNGNFHVPAEIKARKPIRGVLGCMT